MKLYLKKILKWLGIISLFPVLYFLVALLLSYISVYEETPESEAEKIVFLNSNGVHLDIVFAIQDVPDSLKTDLVYAEEDQYLSFGWGDEGFYLNTPTWADLSFKTAFNAAFLDGPTLMHLTPFKQVQPHWIRIPVTAMQFGQLTTYISQSFKHDARGQKILIPDARYRPNDTFYKATGNYSIFKTCNSWANTAFKSSGLKAAIWTPFDFGLVSKYEK